MTDQELKRHFQLCIWRRAEGWIKGPTCARFFDKFSHHFNVAIAGIDLEELRAEAVIDKRDGGINDLCNLVRERLWLALSGGSVPAPHPLNKGPNPYKEHRPGSGQTISPKGHQAPVQVNLKRNAPKV